MGSQKEGSDVLVEWWEGLFGTGWTATAAGAALVVLVAAILYVVTRRYLLVAVRAVVSRTRMSWDEIVFDQRVLRRAALLVPLLAVQIGIEAAPGLSQETETLIQRLIGAALILVAALIFDSLLSASHALYQRLPMAGRRPIKSYIQLAKIFIYAIAAIFVIARLAGRSPWFFVSGLGAMMAVILLLFRDTLLSLVASVQLTNNDLVRVGDWIEMPQFNADGDVIDIALNNVKVQNWDKTISVIPTHKFLEHSFKNWRSMFEGGGRRIKRAIHINTATVRFLTDAEIERFSHFALLKDYMGQKKAELTEYNARFDYDPAILPNARRLTNIGTLRAYVIGYLRSHPGIRQDLTFLVRQLSPTPEGLPLEIYVFTNDTRWAPYEGIQADIFDHILSMVPEFGLRVYQRPSGHDLAATSVAAEE
jgi:miniconductance mechanosensitive channel